MIHTLKVSIHSRGKGHSATAGIAYRCGLDLLDLDDKWHSYGHRKSEVIEHGIAGGDFDDPQEWAYAIEGSETRKNSQLYRDIQLGLPHELDERDQIHLALSWAVEKAEEYGTSACWAVHRPSEEGDQRNTHAHILLATRALTSERSFDGGEKIRSIDAATLRRWHDEWDLMQKQACADAGVEYDPIPDPEGQPGVHLGPAATALERNAAAAKDAKRRERQRKPSAAEQLEDLPFRRSIRELLTYTKGVTVRGQEWLRIDRLLEATRRAQRALERTRVAIQDAILRRAETVSAGESEPAADPPATPPQMESPAPTPQPTKRRKRRRRKRVRAKDETLAKPSAPPQPTVPDPALQEAFEAGWNDAHEDFTEFVAWLPQEDGHALWTDRPDYPGLPDPSGDTVEDAYRSGMESAGVRVDQFFDTLPADLQERIRSRYFDWETGGDPAESPDVDDNDDASAAPGTAP